MARLAGAAAAMLGAAIAFLPASSFSSDGRSVAVVPGKSRYAPGELIVVRVVNRTGTRALVPRGEQWCSAFVFQQQRGSAWRQLDVCPASASALGTVPAGKAVSGTVARAVRGPVATGSVAPTRLDVDLRTLPVLPTPGPGEPLPPAREVPQGILSSDQSAGLPPGRYRLVLRYLEGNVDGAARRVASRPFVVG